MSKPVIITAALFGLFGKPPAIVTCGPSNVRSSGHLCIVTPLDKGKHTLSAKPHLRTPIEWSGGGAWSFEAIVVPRYVTIDGKRVWVQGQRRKP